MSRGQIFISYRRDDAAGYARALFDRLVQHFSSLMGSIQLAEVGPSIAAHAGPGCICVSVVPT